MSALLRPLAAAIVTALLVLPGAAGAQEAREPPKPEFKPRIGQVAPGRCAQGACDWVSIESADYLGAGEKGWLMRLETRWWRSSHPDGYQRRAPRKPAGDRTLHVFCSKSEPAIVEPQDGAWRATMLAPWDRAFATGPAESLVALYWLACHDVVVEDVERQGPALARRLGYPAGPMRGAAQRKLPDPLDALRW